jgi:glucose-1-phosphate cytidylyltransferase
MKAVILAGGRGTRLAEETQVKPKPLVEAGGKPLIWHIMQNYARFGITEFVVLVGYKGQLIREYFANFWLNQADITFDLSNPEIQVHQTRGQSWKVSVIDTGLETMTGGRLARLKNLLDEDFLLTYGDGVSDVDIDKLLKKHNENKSLATLTAVQPPARFGALDFVGNQVVGFREKPIDDEGWVNGGFFVLSPKIFDYITNDLCSFESDVLPSVAKQGQLSAYKHSGFWQPVDTIRDLERLEVAIADGALPWKI